jgi:pimeloyl-ACP methyl ester carboxylesterase
MNNKPIFIPGSGEKPSKYRSLSKYFDVREVDWNTDKVTPPLKKAEILAGFSMGCAIIAEYAAIHKVEKLVFCSLPPCETLISLKAAEVVFIVGEKEEFILKNVRRVAKTLPKSTKRKIVVVPEAGHMIDANYREMLISAL